MQQTWVWHKPSWRRLPLTPHRAARTYTGLENRLFEGTNRTLCTRTQEKGAVTSPRDWPRLACSVQESPVEAWAGGALCRVGGTECSSTCMGSFEGSHHYFITSTIVWSQVISREGMQLHPSTENWINHLLSMAPPVRTRPGFPLVNLSHEEASISLLSFSIRGQTDWKPQSQKTNQSDHMDHSLVQLSETMRHAA